MTLLEYPIPLRDGTVLARLIVPNDLTEAEALRISFLVSTIFVQRKTTD